jgi:DNA-binding transcriptional MerR regulator
MSQLKIDRDLNADDAWVYQDTKVRDTIIFWQLKYGFNLVELDNYIEEDGWDSPAAQENREFLFQQRAKALKAQENQNEDAVEALLSHLALAMRLGKHFELLIPKAKLGKKFSAGRKPGTAGPVRRAIRRYLKSDSQARAAQIWSGLKSKPPKGMEFYESSQGPYIWTEGHGQTQYAQFRNLVTMERQLLKAKKA